MTATRRLDAIIAADARGTRGKPRALTTAIALLNVGAGQRRSLAIAAPE